MTKETAGYFTPPTKRPTWHLKRLKTINQNLDISNLIETLGYTELLDYVELRKSIVKLRETLEAGGCDVPEIFDVDIDDANSGKEDAAAVEAIEDVVEDTMVDVNGDNVDDTTMDNADADANVQLQHHQSDTSQKLVLVRTN